LLLIQINYCVPVIPSIQYLHVNLLEEISVSVQEKINQEIKSSMRNKDRFRLNSLKYIKSLLQENSLSNKSVSEVDVIMSHHKKMSKMLSVYKEGKALDDLKKELIIIKEFVPKSMGEDEIAALVDKHLSLGNMGAVMKAVKAEITGPFDGKLVSSLVKSKLS